MVFQPNFDLQLSFLFLASICNILWHAELVQSADYRHILAEFKLGYNSVLDCRVTGS